jgi:hypothetical protein
MEEKQPQNRLTIFHIFWAITTIYGVIQGFSLGQNMLNGFGGAIIGAIIGAVLAYIIAWVFPILIIGRIVKDQKKD